MAQILDQFGRPAAVSKPEAREIASISIRDRWSSYPSSGLTPSRLTAIFRAADAGSLRDQAELFEEMEEKDAHLFAVMQTRRLAVLGLPWQVEAASNNARDKSVAEFCRKQLEALDLTGLLQHLLGAIGHGYAAAEIVWGTGERATVEKLNFIHPKNITFMNSLIPLVVTEENWQGVEPRPWQLIYHRYAARSGHDTRNGVLRVCAYMYLFKNYALKDWAVFNEVFGMPLRLGKYDPSATQSDREALRQAIASLGSDAAGIISKNTEIEFVEATQRLSGTTNPYEVMAHFCNREMSKAVLGQTLTTDTQGATGTYAAGRVQAEVRRDLLEADARALAQTIRQQLLRPLVGFNFGWEAAVPRFTLLLQDSPDLKADAEVLKILVEAGLAVPAGWAYEHFGIPSPRQGEEVLAGGRGTTPPERQAAKQAVLTLREGGLELLPQDAEVIRRQQELEQLAQAAMDASNEAEVRMLAPVRELIETGESLEAVRERLMEVYPEMPIGDLGELLYRAGMLAYMKARVENA